MTFFNIFFLMRGMTGVLELITPPNDGCIYNGTFRKSIIDLSEEIERDYHGNPIYDQASLKVVERNVSITELLNASNQGRLIEVFGGASVSNFQPISEIAYDQQLIKAT